MNKKEVLLASLRQRKCLKVIAGINNFDINKVSKMASVSEKAQATCIDIAADENIIQRVKAIVNRSAIVVSALLPSKLAMAQELGADVLELGNFDELYEKGIFYSAAEVYELAKEIIQIRKTQTLVSITVPGHLPVAEQVDLAQKLEDLGVDILQTEGSALVTARSAGALGQIEKVRLTLANTMEIAKSTNKAFVLTASGISPDTVKLALAAGAHGVGVGSYINKLDTDIGMLAAIKALQSSLGIHDLNKRAVLSQA